METDKRSADIFRRGRELAGMSKEDVALEIGVSRKTIWSWENGFSYPTMKQLFEWFKSLQLNPYPYLYSYYQDVDIPPYCEDVTQSLAISDKRRCVRDFVSYSDERTIDMLYNIIYAEHGTDVDAFLNLCICYLFTDLKDKITQAALIKTNYELSHNKNEGKGIQPDGELVRKAILSASEAYQNGLKKYNLKEKTVNNLGKR